MPHYDYDKDYPFAAFITNLGKYNEGALVGEWVKFPTTAEELKKVFERIGIGAKDDFGQTYEEWFITDYDCYVDGLYDLLGEYANLDELNYLASKLDDMSQDEYERFQAAMEIGDHTGSIQELINLTENLDCYDVYPDIHDHDDLGRYYIEEAHRSGPEPLSPGRAWGDLRHCGRHLLGGGPGAGEFCVPAPGHDPEVHRAIQAAGAVRQHQRADRIRSRGAGKPAAHGGNDPGG